MQQLSSTLGAQGCKISSKVYDTLSSNIIPPFGQCDDNYLCEEYEFMKTIQYCTAEKNARQDKVAKLRPQDFTQSK